jgi:hypothetical protein
MEYKLNICACAMLWKITVVLSDTLNEGREKGRQLIIEVRVTNKRQQVKLKLVHVWQTQVRWQTGTIQREHHHIDLNKIELSNG